MAPTPEQPPIRVLLTGYGPFARTLNNPSWLAVKDLNGTFLHPLAAPASAGRKRPPIHITSFEVPVVYSSVLAIVPPLHHRPPQLPSPDLIRQPVVDPGLPPPADGYDFIMHVGLGARGGLCLEKRGRKENYFIRDVDGKLAPIISSSDDDGGSARKELSEQVRFEAERAAAGGSSGSAPDDPRKAVKRGFADGYEQFPTELWSELEVEKIVSHVKKSTGIEKIKPSEDAGLYLCEFINYCAMAESNRKLPEDGGKKSKVLFVHVPPIGEDLTLDEITKGLTSIVEYVCWDASAGGGGSDVRR